MASIHRIYRPRPTINTLLAELAETTRELERLRKELVDPREWPVMRGPVEYAADEDVWEASALNEGGRKPMKELSPEVRDVLREAKGLVARRWFGRRENGCLSTFGAPNGQPYCVLTALSVTSDGWSGAGMAAAGLIEAELGVSGVLAIADWNNAPERTHAQVVALFDRVLTGDTPPAPDPEDSRQMVAA